MKFNIYNGMRTAMVVAVAAVSFSCSSELTQSAAPIELIVTNSQDLTKIDIDPFSQASCDAGIGTVSFQAILKNPSGEVNQQFNDVRITRYRVSYVRTDGGTLVPSPFVRSVDVLVPAGGSANTTPVLLQSDAILQQPFAALRPQNGGRDPETGRTVVRMDAIVDYFGETLAGSNVAGRTRFPLDFCFSCDGCS